jgi:hypothetical protein
MPVGCNYLTEINEIIKNPCTVSCFPNPIDNYLFVSAEDPVTEILIYNFWEIRSTKMTHPALPRSSILINMKKAYILSGSFSLVK